jgi:hypothetical protein
MPRVSGRLDQAIEGPRHKQGSFYREKDTEKRCFAALRRSARIRSTRSKKNRDLHIVIDTIPHSQQRYSTVGDWQIDKAGKLAADIVAGDLTLVDSTPFRSTRFTLGS